MIRRYLVVMLFVFVVVAAGGTQWLLPASAQSSGWLAPVELGGGWFPDLAVGPTGSVHVIWHAGRSWPIEPRGDLPGAGPVSEMPLDVGPGNDVPLDIGPNGEGEGEDTRPLQDRRDILVYREFRNGDWAPENNLFVADFGVSGLTVRNSIVLGRDGHLHILFRNGFGIDYFHAPWEQAWSAAVWSEPYTVSSGSAYYNALAVDSTGRLHMLWTRTVADNPQQPRQVCPGCSQLFYRHAGDVERVWSWPFSLSRDFEGANRPQIKIDQRDRIHVVWDEGFDWYAGTGEPLFGVYRRSDDGGQTWNAPVPLGIKEEAVYQITLALMADGNPFVVYRGVDSQRLYYQQAIDATTWGSPAEVPGVRARNYESDNKLDAYSMVIDSAGTIHLLMSGYLEGQEDGTLSLLYLNWNGTNWSTPEVVVNNERIPEWPRLAIANGNQLHAVWFSSFDRDTRVYYSSRTVNAPARPALALFTATPALVPTTTATPVQPTPTPTLPPEVLNAPVLQGEPQWEGPGLTTIGIALIPLVGLLLVYSGTKWRTRRRNMSRWR